MLKQESHDNGTFKMHEKQLSNRKEFANYVKMFFQLSFSLSSQCPWEDEKYSCLLFIKISKRNNQYRLVILNTDSDWRSLKIETKISASLFASIFVLYNSSCCSFLANIQWGQKSRHQDLLVTIFIEAFLFINMCIIPTSLITCTHTWIMIWNIGGLATEVHFMLPGSCFAH